MEDKLNEIINQTQDQLTQEISQRSGMCGLS